MRLAGIPARVVVGYLGGEYNDLGGFFLVHEADTHAWCEVWIPGNGWTRVDPTSVVAPGRAIQDLSSFLAGRVASGEMATRKSAFITELARLALVKQIRSIWEALNYQWDTRVMGFVQRVPWEGPSDFATRAAKALPNESRRVRQITETYIALRYAPGPAAANLRELAKEVTAFTAHR
jgi:hypothetical protein